MQLKKKSTIDHIKMINLFPFCYKVLFSALKINRTSLDQLKKWMRIKFFEKNYLLGRFYLH